MTSPSLQKAFALFSKESVRLQEAYYSLKKECEHLKDELHEKNLMMSNLLMHISQGLIFISQDGILKIINKTAARLLALSEKEVLGLPYSTVFDDDFFGFSLKKALASPKRGQDILLLSFDEEREIEVTRSSLPGNEGLLLLLRELTEEKRWKKILERNQRLKELGEMAATLAHEIRNPLGGIEGFASLLFKDLEDAPPLREMVGAIMEGTKNLNSLVTNILDYTRPLHLHLAPHDLVVVAKQAVTLLEADHRNKCKISLEIVPLSLLLYLDGPLIQAALVNLLLNALEASPEAGKIVLSLSGKGKYIYLKVIDQGKGIEKKDLDKLFTPFFTTKKEGNGIGLTEVLKTIEAHGGTLKVASKIGSGTTFTIKLPTKGYSYEH